MASCLSPPMTSIRHQSDRRAAPRRAEREAPRRELQWLRLSLVAVDTGTFRGALRIGHNVHCGESVLQKVRADGGREVGRSAIPRPDHGGRRSTPLRSQIDGMKDILIGNIAADAADQDDVGADRTFIHRPPRGVGDNALALAQAGRVRPRASDCHRALASASSTRRALTRGECGEPASTSSTSRPWPAHRLTICNGLSRAAGRALLRWA
jgi:hypothetical protein